MSSHQGYISTIFQSVQGEGLYVGERQIFIRFKNCNLTCAYCDESDDKPESSNKKSDKNTKVQIQSPVTVEECIKIIDEMASNKKLFHSVSLTGGEPLLQVDFLKEFLPELKMPKYLETNGTLPSHFQEIFDLVDIIAMDFKLSSATKGSSYNEEHRKFIKAALGKDFFIKAVFSKESTIKEIDEMATIIADEDRSIPLILQPVTPSRNYKSVPLPDQILAFQAVAKRKLDKVLVIPQTHKIMGLD